MELSELSEFLEEDNWEERATCEFAAAQYATKWRYDVEAEPASFPPMAHDVELEDQR